MLGLAVVPVFVNRNPIDRLAVFVRAVGISLVMLHMDAFIENLTEADGDRFQNAEQAIKQRRTEIGIVNEVVGNAVDVPGNANRVDESKDEHEPKRDSREQIEHSKKERAVS